MQFSAKILTKIIYPSWEILDSPLRYLILLKPTYLEASENGEKISTNTRYPQDVLEKLPSSFTCKQMNVSQDRNARIIYKHFTSKYVKTQGHLSKVDLIVNCCKDNYTITPDL